MCLNVPEHSLSLYWGTNRGGTNKGRSRGKGSVLGRCLTSSIPEHTFSHNWGTKRAKDKYRGWTGDHLHRFQVLRKARWWESAMYWLSRFKYDNQLQFGHTQLKKYHAWYKSCYSKEYIPRRLALKKSLPRGFPGTKKVSAPWFLSGKKGCAPWFFWSKKVSAPWFTVLKKVPAPLHSDRPRFR